MIRVTFYLLFLSSMQETVQSHHSFVIKEVLMRAWHFTRKYFKTVLILLLISFIPSFVENLYNIIIQQIPGATIYNPQTEMIDPIGIWLTISNILTIIVGITWAWLGLGLVKSYLEVIKDKKPAIATITSTPRIQVARLIGGGILVGGAVIIGVIALILPGIWIAVRLSLFQYFIAEGYGAIDAIKASRHATNNNFWKILGIGFIYLGMALLGILALWIGLFWALPTIGLAQALVYSALKSNIPPHLQPLAVRPVPKEIV